MFKMLISTSHLVSLETFKLTNLLCKFILHFIIIQDIKYLSHFSPISPNIALQVLLYLFILLIM